MRIKFIIADIRNKLSPFWNLSSMIATNNGPTHLIPTEAERCEQNKQLITDALNKLESQGNKEYILCAAIWFDDGKEYAHQPKNVKTGLVFCGWRHGCIFPQIGGTVKERQDLLIFEKEQGFLTNENRFVDRKEAAKIAIASGQITDVDNNYLFSEDLW